MTSILISETKQDDYLKRIEAEFRSTLDKRFTELEHKFSSETKEKRLLRPKILGGEVVTEVEVEVEVPVEDVKKLDERFSPSPTVEEIVHEPQVNGESGETEQEESELV